MSRIGLKRCAVTTAAVLVWFLAGCGGGGGGDGQDSSSQGNSVSARSSVAGQTLVLNGVSPREITFEPSGNIWTENRDGAVRGGTYEYHPSGSSAALVLSESGVASTLQLNFASANSGTYIGGQDQGTFQLRAAQNEPIELPGPADPGSAEGLAPLSLDGQVMHGTRTFTSTGPKGQTHTYTFSGNTFHDSDPPEESDGQYIYAPAVDKATLSLIYYAPKEFDGDRHEMEMSFSTKSSGTFQSVYTRRDGTTIQIHGTFQME
jgi:hypothetical protein